MKKTIAVLGLLVAMNANAWEPGPSFLYNQSTTKGTSPTNTSHYAEANAAPPNVCTSVGECNAMWNAAQVSLQQQTQMRLSLVTDSLIETYPNNNLDYLVGSVSKVQQGDGSFRFDVSLEERHPGTLDNVVAANEKVVKGAIRLAKLRYALEQDMANQK